MKRKLKGILSLTVLSSAVLVLLVYNWKELLVGVSVTVAAVLAVVIILLLVAFIGTGTSGDRWDKD